MTLLPWVCVDCWFFLLGPVRQCDALWGLVCSYPPAAATLGGKIIATIGATIKGCCNPTPAPPSCSFLGIPCYGVDYQACPSGLLLNKKV